jgi:hypothetical protein
MPSLDQRDGYGLYEGKSALRLPDMEADQDRSSPAPLTYCIEIARLPAHHVVGGLSMGLPR